jgi:hypothetical protein
VSCVCSAKSCCWGGFDCSWSDWSSTKAKVENGRDGSRSVRNRLPFYSNRFRFSGKIRKRDRKRDGMHRDWDRKRDEGFSVHIYGIAFLTGIIPFSSRLQLIRDKLLAYFENMRPGSAHLYSSVSCTLSKPATASAFFSMLCYCVSKKRINCWCVAVAHVACRTAV